VLHCSVMGGGAVNAEICLLNLPAVPILPSARSSKSLSCNSEKSCCKEMTPPPDLYIIMIHCWHHSDGHVSNALPFLLRICED
jgi:hypothetical protein